MFFCLCLQDAHNCILEFDEETSMFAVYDGHGGRTHNLLLTFFFLTSLNLSNISKVTFEQSADI